MKNRIIDIALVLASSFFLAACTGKFEQMNTPPSGVTDEELAQDNNYIGMHFPTIQKSIYWNNSGAGWEFQLTQNLTSDVWGGYVASPTNFKGGINTQTYAITHDWSDKAWMYTYDDVMKNQLTVKDKCQQLGMDVYGHFDAINTILRVFAMSRVCDEYGPIIYSHFGESMTHGIYDSAEEAYEHFFIELANATDVLQEYIEEEECASFAKFDLTPFKGNLHQWLRLCNTLRLRLAMRIVKYDADWAELEGEAAIQAPGGLLRRGDVFSISGFGWLNPLYTCSVEYNDMFINANVQSILEGYEDARLLKMGVANHDKVLGIRSGLPGLENLGDRYKSVISHVNVEADSPAVLMTASEAYFLLAEAALRGWKTKGSAKMYYELGVRTSFYDFGVTVGDYLERSNIPADWVDPIEEKFDADAVSTISPRWEDAQTDEERLEKIITQKWIAGFPEGKNAWAEYRRTGYPKLFPVLENNSQGEVTTEYGVRRLPFTTYEHNNNPEGYADAVNKLGGPDSPGTRLFWDIEKGNFE